MTTTTPAYETYAKQLFGCGFGYPLWHPEPDEGHDIDIGDVGYLYQGSFSRIFNTILPEKHESNQNGYGVPDNYQPFQLNPKLRKKHAGVFGPSLSSSSVKSLKFGGGATTVTPLGALAALGAGVKIMSEEDQGAFVFVDLPADRTQMHPSKSFRAYMKTNIEDWSELAHRNDLDIPKEGLICVSGTVKTNDWFLGAFKSHGQRCEVDLEMDVNFAKANFVYNRSTETKGNVDIRKRPRILEEQQVQAIESGPASGSGRPFLDSVRSDHQKKDQTLFLHYYKMKKRLWSSRAIQAAAGPHDLDHGSSRKRGDSSIRSPSSGDSDVVDEPHIPWMYDPVDHLLDYILNYPIEGGTEVQVAIASDTHLYALFDGDVPLDIPAALEKMRPPIVFLDEKGELASLAIAEWSDEDEGTDAGTIRDTGKGWKELQTLDDNNHQMHKGKIYPSESKQDKDSESRLATISRAAQAGQPIILQHTCGFSCVAFSPNGRYIASGSDTGIILRDASDGDVIHMITKAISTLAFAPDSRSLASGASNGTALVWDLEHFAVVAVLGGHSGDVQTIAYSPDGSKLVTSSVDSTVRIWDAVTGSLLHSMEDHKAVVKTALFSPDGRWIASCGADYKAKIWDAETGALRHTLAEHTGVVWSMGFSPDSRKVVTGSDDTTSRIWNAETGEELVILREHNRPVSFVAFSPAGKYVMSASKDATIKVCDALTGERVQTFDRHHTLVNAVVFSPDGKYIASSADNDAVMVWNVETGTNFPPMEGHLDKVTGLQFSPEGDRIASCSDDSTVRIWTLPEAEPVGQA